MLSLSMSAGGDRLILSVQNAIGTKNVVSLSAYGASVKLVRDTGSDLLAFKKWTFMWNFLSVFRSIDFAVCLMMPVDVLPGSIRA